MSQLIVRAGDFTLKACFEEQLAMPFESQAIHGRWSGEGEWMPLSLENLAAFGKTVLWKGAQKTHFEEV